MPVESPELSQISEKEIFPKPNELISEFEKDLNKEKVLDEEKIEDTIHRKKYYHIDQEGYLLIDDEKIYADWNYTDVDFVKIPDTYYFCTIDSEKNVKAIFGISAVANRMIFFKDFFSYQEGEESREEYDERLKKLRLLRYELKISNILENLNKPIDFYSLPAEIKRLLIEPVSERYEERYIDKHIEGLDNLKKITDKFGSEGLKACAVFAFASGGDCRLLFETLQNSKKSEIKKYILDKLNNELLPLATKLYFKIAPAICEISKSGGSEFTTYDYAFGKYDIGVPIYHFVFEMNEILKENPDLTIDQYKSIIENPRYQSKLIPEEELQIENEQEKILNRVSTGLASRIGPELFIDSANKLFKQTKSENFKKLIDQLFSHIIPEVSPEILHDLEDLYNNIKFEGYKLNEAMQQKDENILKNILGEPKQAGKILDSGCGTGRLLISLYKKGYDIEGIDLSQRHLDIIHNSHPDIYTVKEDWTDMKSIPNKKYDSIFSLGRNIMHEYLPNRQISMFKEANRVIKLGGKFIFDVPDPNKGQYKNLIRIFQESMQKNHVHGFRKNTIYDSPDGKNYFFRYVYSDYDVESLAWDNGFKIVDIKEIPLETGKGDINKYYILEKISDIKE